MYMSYRLILLLGLFSLVNRLTAQMNRQTDSLFLYHLSKMDVAANKSKNNTVVYCCSGSISIMERISGILCASDGTTFGKLYFTKSELERWRKWYFANTYVKPPKNKNL